jgi:GNAT superfamily N-acetyltransferase
MNPIEIWAFGYALTRGYPAPETVTTGLWLEVGKPDQRGRFVLPEFDPAMFSELARSIEAPGIYIEAPAPREAAASLLPDKWTVRERAFLMTTALGAPHRLPLPPGYRLAAQDDGGAIKVEVTNDDGELAASGSAGLTDGHAVFDQILTQAAHRRLGLGTTVMGALTRRAMERGANQGTLIATPNGRALYQVLGWEQWSEVTSVISPGR